MITIVIGGQYGSEGKGSVVSWLCRQRKFDLAIRTGAPNAGHTFKTNGGQIVKMRQLPCSWDSQPDTPMYLPAGAVINLPVLASELQLIKSKGINPKFYVSPQAAVIQEGAGDKEAFIQTGTTGEGVGITRSDKLLRTATLMSECFKPDDEHFDEFRVMDILRNHDRSILIESTQGFGLSNDYLTYPYVTSTNLDVHRILSDARVPFGVHKYEIWMVVRTHPIRIAGNSGGLFQETTWEALRAEYGDHIPIEQTTVTKKTRRVGAWDRELVSDAIKLNNPTYLVLTFVDYIFPNIKATGITREINHWLLHLEGLTSCQFTHLGIGIGEVMPRAYYGEQEYNKATPK